VLATPSRQRQSLTRSQIAQTVALALLVSLTGCVEQTNGNKGAKDSDTQLAVEINGKGISVHQVQAALNNAPKLAVMDPTQASSRVLESLIEQELATQAARSTGLDRSPNVIQAIEVAKREVTARFYQDQLAAKAPRPTDAEIEQYYVDNPLLFSNRRIYTMQEMAVQGAAAKVDQAIAATSSAGEVELAVRKVGLQAQSRVVVQSAEDIPLALLGRIAALAPGRSVVVTQGPAVRVFTLITALPAPVDRAQSRAAIAAFLAAESRREAVRQGMKALRDSAQIRYLGNFSKSSSQIEPAPAAVSAGARSASAARP